MLLQVIARVQCEGHEARDKLLKTDVAAAVCISGIEHLGLGVPRQVLMHVLEDHAELLKIDLVVAIRIVVREEGSQYLAHPSNFIHGLLVQKNMLQVSLLTQSSPIPFAELCHGATQRQLALPHSLHVSVSNLVVHLAFRTVCITPADLQVVKELHRTHQQTDQRPRVFSFCLLDQLSVARRLLIFVNCEGSALNDDVANQRAQHHPAPCPDRVCIANPGALQTPRALGVELVPRLRVGPNRPLVRRDAALECHTACHNGNEPRQSQQHDRAASKGTDTDRNLVLGIWAQTREEHHHAIWHRAQDRQDHAPDQGCKRRYEKE
mmetsp:Transcript_52343/g.137399  ORF Transcript_52343/g.137399 Transcript_52343/m.137399 type:complete len:322 (-) Transcript_52343:221-1186(-)